MRRCVRGFTLIELLLVIGIIVLLMALLAPAMNAVIQAVKVRETDRRIAALDRAVHDYHRTYNAYPPCASPDRDMDRRSTNAYRPYQYPDGSEASYIFKHGAGNLHPFGGKFLVYFLMGPYGTGWHRPKNPGDTRDPDYRNKCITAEWDVPPGLSEFLDNSPLSQGSSQDYPFACFVDAFGLGGRNGGIIGYQRADVRKTGAARWTGDAFASTFYWDCRTYSGSWGDGRGNDHKARILAQCPHDFALISPGADGAYGYRVYGMEYGGEYRKGSYANYDEGVIDDQANFPLQ